ncbi:MAG TPA: hypothetical protein VFY29_14045 [Terriglobia bacterium]|nr:hypothetical protein [Terriglobia bacterium]
MRLSRQVLIPLTAFSLLAAAAIAAGFAAPQAPRGGAGRGAAGAEGNAGPAPRWPNGGHVTLMSGKPGEAGLWLLGNGNGGSGTGVEVPYQDWTRAVSDDRRQNNMEPHTRCKPSGGVRQFLTPYGVEFVELPELQRIYIMDIGGPHTFRVIYMDARSHPGDLVPSYYGHSIGHWEGDTLVVDTVGFNEKFWIDRGQFPHTEALHLTERFTRTSASNMNYDYTIDDPGAYTAPFSRSAAFTFRAGTELFEYVCQDNNFAPELLVGTHGTVSRYSLIIP